MVTERRKTWSVVERLVADTVVLTPAEDRLQALEQLVAVMQSKVISGGTAVAQAEQRVTDAETRVLGVRGGVVDTRLLRKPKSFDGTTCNWRQFKFTFLGYAGDSSK